MPHSNIPGEIPSGLEQISSMTPTAKYVQDLAMCEGVTYRKTRGDEWCEAVTRLTGDDIETDDTERLLIALRRSRKISGSELVSLLARHLRELKKDA